MIRKKWLAADFETDKTPQVLIWHFYSEELKISKIGISLESFFEEILKLDDDYIIYFNNGAKFDFQFFPKYFKENKWEQWKDASECKEKNIEYEPLLKEKQFKFLAGEGKKIFSLQIALPKKRANGKHFSIVFKDSLLLWQVSIEKMGKYLNKLNLLDEKYLKGKIDYDALKKYNNIKELEEDKKVLDYVHNDVKILYTFLEYVHRNLVDMRFWKFSIAGTSFNLWHISFGNKLIKQNKDTKIFYSKNGFKTYFYKQRKINPNYLRTILVKTIFPTKWLDEDDNFNKFYNWYSGGWTSYNPDYRGLVLKNVTSCDRNSSFPYELVNSLFPCKVPIKGNVKDAKLKIYSINLLYAHNKEGMPFLARAGFDYREYLKTPEPGIYYVTSRELENFKKYYKGTYKIRCEYSFETISGNFVFGDYINFWNDKKEQAKRDKNEIIEKMSKNLENSLYGKMGTKKYRTSMKLDENYEWESVDKEIDSNYYLPIAFFTTANARMAMVEIVDRNYKNFIYADTDSLYLKNSKDFKIPYHPTKLGDWKKEHDWEYFVVKDKKSYMGLSKQEGKIVKSSGYLFEKNFTKKFNFSDFLLNKNNIYVPSTRGEKVFGGVIITAYEKMIKPIWEMSKHKEQWFFNKEEYLKKYDEQLKLIDTQ